MSADEYLSSLKPDMEKALEAFKRELTSVRTGRATPSLIEHVQVEVYGSHMPLKQMANIAAPDARLLIVNPWDKSTIKDIERAITTAGLGLNPASDGQVVRVPIPALTGDRRKELVKQVGKIAEEVRVRLRGIRREYNELLKDAEKEKDITEDQLKSGIEKVQKMTDDYIKKVDEVSAAKGKDVLTV